MFEFKFYLKRNYYKITSNKERETKIGYNCNSFDRFGDDLCQLLLSYLTVKQKLRFECVSKQWKSLIFNKQQKLIINYINLYQYSEILRKILVLKNNSIIKCLTKKFKFINELKINFGVSFQLLEIIVKNCLHLKKINVNFGDYFERKGLYFK